MLPASLLKEIPGFDKLPPSALEVILVLFGIILNLIIKGGTDEAQDEALMAAGEEAKRLADKKKFGGGLGV
jgi:hypothetical protein